MDPYVKEFEIRWNDLDVNRHLANSSYVEYTVHTRMSFLRDNGITQSYLAKKNIGPVIISEEFNYTKEIFGNDKAYCDVELLGHSEDKRFGQFSHGIYNGKKELSAYSIVTFCWLDLGSRKITSPTKEILDMLGSVPKSDRFKILSPNDTMKSYIPHGKILKV